MSPHPAAEHALGETAAGAVACIDGFLGPDECATILNDLDFAWWWQSQVVRSTGSAGLVSHQSVRRTSETSSETWLSQESVRILRRMERRVATLYGIGPPFLETWQITRYRRGGYFDEHHDAGYFSTDVSGERTHTILLYLTTSASGGATRFPRLKLAFRPVQGRLLFWRNLLPDGTVDESMRHLAAPARQRKAVLTTWARQYPVPPTSKE